MGTEEELEAMEERTLAEFELPDRIWRVGVRTRSMRGAREAPLIVSGG